MERYGVTNNEKDKRDKVDKAKTAVALQYDPKEEVPKIIASGRGLLAERIIDAANEADIPVHKDEKLAETLSRLNIDDYIPPQLYEVVAEILVFVDKADSLKERVAMSRKAL